MTCLYLISLLLITYTFYMQGTCKGDVENEAAMKIQGMVVLQETLALHIVMVQILLIVDGVVTAMIHKTDMWDEVVMMILHETHAPHPLMHGVLHIINEADITAVMELPLGHDRSLQYTPKSVVEVVALGKVLG